MNWKKIKSIINSVRYGKVTIHLQAGNITHIKKTENIKPNKEVN